MPCCPKNPQRISAKYTLGLVHVTCLTARSCISEYIVCSVGTYHPYSISGGNIGVPGFVDCFRYMLCSICHLSERVSVWLNCGVMFTLIDAPTSQWQRFSMTPSPPSTPDCHKRSLINMHIPLGSVLGRVLFRSFIHPYWLGTGM